VGRDFERKGGLITYEAFKKLKQSNHSVELHVAGPHNNPIDNPADGYYFYGDITYDKVAELYNKCDIFCMPSYFEAYGLVFVEAMAFGLPCIGRNCYDMPYIIEDGVTGLLLRNDNVGELASLMEQLLQDDTIKNNVLSRKDYLLNEYSWDTVAGRIHEVIEKDNEENNKIKNL